jgi:hypothetical protein
MTMPIEPPGGYPGDAEGAWAGDPGTVLEGGGQIASRGTGDTPLPADAAPVVDSIAQWPPSSWGPKLYEIDAQSGARAGPAAKPGE